MSKNPRYPVDADIGGRTRALLAAKREQVTKLAEFMGITQSGLSQKMVGAVRWSALDVLRAAAFFDVDAYDLMPRPRDAMAMLAAHDRRISAEPAVEGA